MDPDACVAEILSLVAESLDVEMPDGEASERLQELATKLQALDTWIVSGGFLPQRWVKDARKQRSREVCCAALVCGKRTRSKSGYCIRHRKDGRAHMPEVTT